MNNGKKAQTKGSSAIPFVVLQLVVLAVGVILFTGVRIGSEPISMSKEADFALALILGVVFLMTTLFVIAAGFAQLDLSDDQQALGLPSGSIRAMIALILILVFIMFGVYLFLQ